jgi:hypothetical protein
MDDLDRHLAAEAARKAAATVDGAHYSAHARAVKAALRRGDDDEAAGLLLRLVAAVEREAVVPLAGARVTEWYHASLADLYSRRGHHAEAAALMQRFAVIRAESERDSMALELKQWRAVALEQRAQLAPVAQPAPQGEAPLKPRRGAVKAGRVLGQLVAVALRAIKRR